MAWWKTAKVGDKLVCVNDISNAFPIQGWPHIGDLCGLKSGCVYTIRRIGPDWRDGSPVIWVNEIIRPLLGCDREEGGFNVRRFRPLEIRKTDISIFTEILNNAPVREVENAK